MWRVKRLKKIALGGFILGALVPLFWGVLAFILFNAPEGWFSRAFWDAVYLTCPFWSINGGKALVLMPLLNGCMYAAVVTCLFTVVRHFASKPQIARSSESSPRQK
jgi:hypothetical protein